ncbi:MAG: class I SAM-dependent methyltransferase [Gammaproteobacteria bacterium]|nr:class I SAM-dependent methyltransferase [Gammaproteobacteria bacterium]
MGGPPSHASRAAAPPAAAEAAADRARDAGRRPAEVLAFLGIGSGMTVMDLIAAGGYYTEVLSLAVGPTGKVYSQNPPRVLQFRDGANEKALSARLADGRLANVERVNEQDLGATGVAPGSLDAAITALNFHDLYNGQGPEAAAGFLAGIRALLKPGGVLGLVDHYGDPAQDNASLHRLDVAAAMPLLEASGFGIESSDVLRNGEDDHTMRVFDPAIRGKTDRVLYKLTKPTEE